MAEACDIHGTAFQHGSVVLLARIVGAAGALVSPAEIVSARYSIALLDETDPAIVTPVSGHTDVSVAVGGLLRESLVNDDAWDLDALGYNFRHELDVAAAPAFALAGRSYRVTFALLPLDGQIILVRFRIHVI